MGETLTCASDAASWCAAEVPNFRRLFSGEIRPQAVQLVTAAKPLWSLGRLAMGLGLVTIPVVVLDQATKFYIATHFPLYSMRAIIRNWLDLTYTLNPGAAFSLFTNMPARMRAIFFIVLSFVAIVVLTVLLARRTTSAASGLAFALILGGTIGNLIDRLARGRVIDFIYFHHDSFSYPVFNVADSTITMGVAIILLLSFFRNSATDQ
jgi:signal peptidase II